MKEVRKAVSAAVFTAVGAFGAALLDGNLTNAELLVSVGTALVAGAATWKVKNEVA